MRILKIAKARIRLIYYSYIMASLSGPITRITQKILKKLLLLPNYHRPIQLRVAITSAT